MLIMGEAAISSGPHTRNASAPAQPLDPGLYVVSTPIGNLRDITLRALDVLNSADVVLAEDTRVTRKLFDAYGVSTALEPYHEHNAAAVRPGILSRLTNGGSAALVSDAGTPLISDPGYKLVREALDAGVHVVPIPGASAVLASLVGAGLPTDRFLFAGFPPAKSSARIATLSNLARVASTLVFYETGPRLASSLKDMAAVFGHREACVARELTKFYEEHRRGALEDLAAAYEIDAPPKGEIVIVVGPPAAAAWNDAQVDAALNDRIAHDGVKAASAAVAELSGRSKRDVYARALELKDRA